MIQRLYSDGLLCTMYLADEDRGQVIEKGEPG